MVNVDLDRLRELHAMGLSDVSIARILRCGRTAVFRRRWGLRLPVLPQNNRKSHSKHLDLGELLRFYERGFNDRMLSEAFQCDRFTIAARRAMLGLDANCSKRLYP